ncbi:MAG TPA: beta-propeller fold lactonase family protein [Edaphobacter sp.]
MQKNPSGGVRFFAALLSLAALSPLIGCGNFFIKETTSSSSSDLIYVANATTETLSGYIVGSGALTAISGTPLSLSYAPKALVVTRANSFLYVAGPSAVYLYTIGTDGVLTADGTASYTDVSSLDVSPDGNWLVGLDAASQLLDIWKINASTGALTTEASASYSISNAVVSPKMVRFSPNGDFIFAALGTGGDVVFTFNTSTGAAASSQILSLDSTTTSDNALAVNSTTSTLYIARSGASSGVAVYTIGSSGALTEISGSPFAAGQGPYAIAIDSTGSYVYAANRTDGTISGFSIGTGSVLTALSGSPYTSGSLPTALATDNSGSYLFAVANGGSPDLTMYTFDSTTSGKLDTTAAATTGTDPTGAIAIAATH